MTNNKPLTKHQEAALMRRLAKARSSLIIDHPFIGTIALNMPMSLSEQVPTAATNGRRVLYNPYFIKDLTDENLRFLVAHECLHPMLEHNARRNGRNHRKWNQAADYVINQLLVDDGIGKFIEGGCLNKQLYDAGNGTSDNIYNLLPDSPDGEGGSDIGGAGADLEDATGSPAEVEQQLAEMKVTVAQAAQAAKLMGKLSTNQARLVNEILSPKVDWRTVLRRFVEKAKNDTRSWARPNRRFLAQGMYLPSIGGEALGELSIAVDCSGSIGEREIAEFAAEITNIWEDQKPVKLHVIYFDSSVCHYEKFERDDNLHIEPHGGGGTAFSPVFRYMEAQDINPVATIFLTDLCCNDFGPQPDHPVLWVSNMEGEAPWGEIVLM